jgi:hypothetical protein
MEAQKIPNSQGSHEQKGKCWKYHNSRLQKQHGTGTKTTCAPMKQNRGHGTKPTQLEPPDSF